MDQFIHAWSVGDENKLRTNGGDWADRALAGWREKFADFKAWRHERDLEAMEDWWGKQVDQLLADEGLRLDPEDHEGWERLV